MITDLVADTIRSLSTVSAEDALRHAMNRLAALGTPDDLEAAVWLQDILTQEGMMGDVCESNRLVDVIDIAVRG